jgi:hypothetical protein
MVLLLVLILFFGRARGPKRYGEKGKIPGGSIKALMPRIFPKSADLLMSHFEVVPESDASPPPKGSRVDLFCEKNLGIT